MPPASMSPARILVLAAVFVTALSTTVPLTKTAVCKDINTMLGETDLGTIMRLFDECVDAAQRKLRSQPRGAASADAHAADADRIKPSLINANLVESLDLQLPEIVMVGAQSTGKSSVLEGITGMSVFPVGDRRVTKLAVRVRLRRILGDTDHKTFCTKNNVQCDPDTSYIKLSMREAATDKVITAKKQQQFSQWTPIDPKVIEQFSLAISEAMNEAGNLGCEQSIITRLTNRAKDASSKNLKRGIDSTKYLQIDIAGRSHQDLNLVDLPGLVLAPGGDDCDDIVQKVDALVDSYLQHDSVVLITHPAPVLNTLTSSGAFNMTKHHGRLKDAVGVLTHVDQIMDIESNPWTRGNLTSVLKGEMQVVGETYRPGHGFLVVASRNSIRHVNGVLSPLSLAETAEAEAAWIKKHLPKELHNTNGQCALIKKLSDSLNSFVQSTWAVKALAKLRSAIVSANAELDKLGVVVPDDYESQQVLFRSIVDSTLAIMANFGDSNEWHDLTSPLRLTPAMFEHTAASHPTSATKFFVIRKHRSELTEHLVAEVSKLIEKIMIYNASNTLSNSDMSLLSRVEKRVQSSDPAQKPKLKHNRFIGLRKHIMRSFDNALVRRTEELLAERVSAIVHREVEAVVGAWADPFFAAARSAKDGTLASNTYPLYMPASRDALLRAVWRRVNFEMIDATYLALPQSADALMPASAGGLRDLFVEDNDTRAKREQLNKVVADLKRAESTINDIAQRKSTWHLAPEDILSAPHTPQATAKANAHADFDEL